MKGRILRLMASATAVAALTLPAAAQEIEEEATEDEIASVVEAIGGIGCELGPSAVEKESDSLFEIDDAACGDNQYDIKLDGDFTIVSITYDGPVDDETIEMEATEDELGQVNEAIAVFGCELGESPVEKESEMLFEIDDAQCEGGQYDIKLDGAFAVINMTRD